MNGILGTSGSDANLYSDLTLLAYIVLLVPAMLVGFFFARRKMFRPYHKMTMTVITVVNWLIILFLMVVRYGTHISPFLQFGLPSERLLPTIHLVTGLVAQLLATWIVLLMWTEKTRYAFVVPPFMRTHNIKPFMRMILALWLVTVALGITTYLMWYPPRSASASSGEPIATEEPIPSTEAPTDEPVATVEIDDDDDVIETEEPDDEDDVDDSENEPVETEEAEDD
jgi:hypothetical protein